jgi:hypothetical protein
MILWRITAYSELRRTQLFAREHTSDSSAGFLSMVAAPSSGGWELKTICKGS